MFKEYFLGNWVGEEELSPKELRYYTERGNHSSTPHPMRRRCCRVPGTTEDSNILEVKREASFKKKSYKSHLATLDAAERSTELNRKRCEVSFIHTILLKWLREKLGRSGLRNLCEVRRFRLYVYLMLLRRFAMKVSRV